MIKKGGKREHFFCNPRALFKKISIILALFWQKKALLLAFNAFFTSTFDKSLVINDLLNDEKMTL